MTGRRDKQVVKPIIISGLTAPIDIGADVSRSVTLLNAYCQSWAADARPWLAIYAAFVKRRSTAIGLP